MQPPPPSYSPLSSKQGYLIRVFILPEQEYSRFSADVLDGLLSEWQALFQDNFGLSSMVYNVHLWVRMYCLIVSIDQASTRHNACMANSYAKTEERYLISTDSDCD